MQSHIFNLSSHAIAMPLIRWRWAPEEAQNEGWLQRHCCAEGPRLRHARPAALELVSAFLPIPNPSQGRWLRSQRADLKMLPWLKLCWCWWRRCCEGWTLVEKTGLHLPSRRLQQGKQGCSAEKLRCRGVVDSLSTWCRCLAQHKLSAECQVPALWLEPQNEPAESQADRQFGCPQSVH